MHNRSARYEPPESAPLSTAPRPQTPPVAAENNPAHTWDPAPPHAVARAARTVPPFPPPPLASPTHTHWKYRRQTESPPSASTPIAAAPLPPHTPPPTAPP